MNIRNISLVFVLLLFVAVQTSFSQEKKGQLFDTGMNYFDNEEYSRAVGYFLTIDSLFPGDFEIQYYIGVCYFNSKKDRAKAMPYLKFALDNGEKYLPEAAMKDLGDLLHKSYEFDDAINAYSKFLDVAKKFNENRNYVKRMIQVCEDAKEIHADSLDTKIVAMKNLNTPFDESSPVLSIDKLNLYFTRKYRSIYDYDSITQIYTVENKFGKWKEPDTLQLNSLGQYVRKSVAGLSIDGSELFLSLGDFGSKEIYSSTLSGNTFTEPEKLSDIINADSLQEGITMTPDGKYYIFSGSRLGGEGGSDLFKVERLPNGTLGKVQSLSDSINTPFDEVSPFMHPDGKTLYFSSNGHKTMGGFDIYKVELSDDGTCTNPVNVGYPVSSTGNDLSYTLSADGGLAILSSDRNSFYGDLDLFKVVYSENIPLTMVKGTILAGDPLVPVGADIKVIDKETGERVKYIYNPNPKTGKYLLIFPPGKNYDMIVQANGYLPHVVNIFVPDQTYFYELFQEIHLNPIMTVDKVVGEEITVKNTFYDIAKTSGDTVKEEEKDYDELLTLIEDLINFTDSVGIEKIDEMSEKVIENASEEEKLEQEAMDDSGFDDLLGLIENAIETTDSTTLNLLNDETAYDEKSSQAYFYSEKEEEREEDLIIAKVENKSIKAVGTIEVKKDMDKRKPEEINVRALAENAKKKTILTFKLYYDSYKFEVNSKYNKDLDEIVAFLKNNPHLGVEIKGYTDATGSDELNNNLSVKRAAKAARYLLDNGISRKRVVTEGLGEKMSQGEKTEADKAENRRAEIIVFEVLN